MNNTLSIYCTKTKQHRKCNEFAPFDFTVTVLFEERGPDSADSAGSVSIIGAGSNGSASIGAGSIGAGSIGARGITTSGFIETHMVSIVVHRGFTLETGAAAFAVLCGVNGFSEVVSVIPSSFPGF